MGTPHVILEGSEKRFSKSTQKNQFEMYDLNQSIVWFQKRIGKPFKILSCKSMRHDSAKSWLVIVMDNFWDSIGD